MKVTILLAALSVVVAKSLENTDQFSFYGFNEKYSIPLGEKIRSFEEAARQSNRIVGGPQSVTGQFPYQAGVLTNFVGLPGTGICGGVLVSHNKIIHAAHCWYDGINWGYLATVVLGSTTLFSGGERIPANIVVLHPDWNPNWTTNDVAVIYLPISVSFTNTISPIALPSGTQLDENFVGELATASGYGVTSNGGSISTFQSLHYVNVTIISNPACRIHYPLQILDSNICTSGVDGKGTCNGDSGGPLTVTRNAEPLLIGITSFGSIFGCSNGFPAGYSRVSYFIDFFNKHL